MDKFLIATNPMGGDTVAIVHMLNPVTVIHVEQGHKESKRPYKQYNYTAPDDAIEPVTFTAMHSHEFNDKEEILIDKLFDKAWHWYIAYRKHTAEL